MRRKQDGVVCVESMCWVANGTKHGYYCALHSATQWKWRSTSWRFRTPVATQPMLASRCRMDAMVASDAPSVRKRTGAANTLYLRSEATATQYISQCYTSFHASAEANGFAVLLLRCPGCRWVARWQRARRRPNGAQRGVRAWRAPYLWGPKRGRAGLAAQPLRLTMATTGPAPRA